MKKVIILFEKLRKRIISFIKCLFWKIAYTKSLQIGKMTVFYPLTHMVIEEKGTIKIGNNCFFNRNCSLNCMDYINIGDDCIFGENVCIYDHNHNYMDYSEKIRKQGYKKAGITIGNNCWVGSNVTILSGVTIGDNVIIGAGTLVNKSLQSNLIVYNKNNLVHKSYREEEV